ncbi:hypothetical protein J3Q64DRAFT_1836707 [Phycomyces blakesleeanus]|uniref:Cysteine-rich transmembrane CYSTM domain-containing protein n=2 Tax=Phycomyces blakesleeanus TaxID=4837 RepID=A0A167PRC4_PHYB8|nr:hypothetical protein PHYBLDRAFT_69658 [Phycomyces blakesleeanus NRRL 1555(-)]OAD78397.1 hypothetical protein PHYBLDRAFT_69658 [Phycomyces blakesleeanus NRRL 1555(-)]|eukprot:XP_018296437.1 hypothetical protein PHYBLDRAFT_69658 [Phycomyces blakesleeanus NRRL 1555(-)]
MDKPFDILNPTPAPLPPPRYRPLSETSVSDPYSTPPPAYQPSLQYSNSLYILPSQQTRSSKPRSPIGAYYYQPLPTPEIKVIHHKPTRSHDACCWGCLVAVLLCFGIKECC